MFGKVGGKIVYPNYLISTSGFYSTFFGTTYLEVEEKKKKKKKKKEEEEEEEEEGG